MSIDARMLLRVKGSKPTDLQIAEWGDALCRSIGAKHFFITDGLPPDEYRIAEKKWHTAFNAHPEYEEWNASRKRDDWLNHCHDDEWKDIDDRIRADVGPAPEERRRSIELTNYIYPIGDDDESIPVEYRQPGRCYTQDGDTIFAKQDEWFLTVSLWSRYYGVDYERGDLLTLCAVAEWCEVNIPNCEVWYGGDSSGVCVEPWPESKRLELRRHLYSTKGRDYFAYSSRYGQKTMHPDPCGLCIGGGRFEQFGSGGSYVAVHCASCGKSFDSRDNGATWQERKEAA